MPLPEEEVSKNIQISITMINTYFEGDTLRLCKRSVLKSFIHSFEYSLVDLACSTY